MQSVLVCCIRLKINSDVTMSNIDWSASHSVCLGVWYQTENQFRCQYVQLGLESQPFSLPWGVWYQT